MRSRSIHRLGQLVALALALATVAPGCGQDDVTELVVAVDTDLSVPGELDAIRIDVVGPQGQLRRATASVRSASELPETLGVVHRTGPLGPVRVTVTGRLDGRDIIQRRAVVDFLPDEIVVLRLWLERSCLGVPCPEDQTCEGGECRSQQVDPGELEPWEGSVLRTDSGTRTLPDGGTDGGDGCVPAPEECNEVDDDCDGDVDEVFDLMRDPDNCGTCGNTCPEDPPNAAGVCIEGSCDLVCDPGWADCSTDVEGCEAALSAASTCGDCETACDSSAPFCAGTDGGGFECVAACGAEQTECGESCVDTTTSPMHCGGCDHACPSPRHATAACAESECGYLCDDGYRDCDGTAGNGCESRLRELANCGACGATCAPDGAIPSCLTGTCEIVACEGSGGDCNGAIADGCEVDLSNDPDHCGGCDVACPADAASATVECMDGRCTAVCDPGFADCNGRIDDGCEASLASTATCGSCGIRCDGTTPVCAGNATDGFACVEDCGSGTLCDGSCVDTTTDPLHCGSCGASCPEPPRSTRSCSDAACGFTCDDGWTDCNGMPDDGCEAHTATDPTRCGDCGTVCPSGMCSRGSCIPVTVMDAGTDAGMDAGTDASVDGGTGDGGPDAGPRTDGGPDAGPPTDGGPDAGPPTDGGPDAGPPADGGPDAGPPTDGGTDAS